MIFAKTIHLVLSGKKSQTCRLAYAGDVLVTMREGQDAVLWAEPTTILGRKTSVFHPRWVVGRTYAVQPERCHKARARIRVTSLAEVVDPTAVGLAFARREGFETVEEYLKVWHELHPKNPVQRCWAIGFELVGNEQKSEVRSRKSDGAAGLFEKGVRS